MQNIEFVNGGNGIKNPSFVAPKPADITNTHQGRHMRKSQTNSHGYGVRFSPENECMTSLHMYL